MAAYRRVYDSRYLQAECQVPGSAAEPYARYSSMGYLYFYTRVPNTLTTPRANCLAKGLIYALQTGDSVQ